ncbi:unnamed protein product [Danaus chrysippus]|uniref:(African queen) hypothetical protein n=1 Tax=Danaus chrysippus TaxID=151541 RepID=A0A8J2R4I1_9NEOP|nr:unnamed protein product [Danaus chrysippus]
MSLLDRIPKLEVCCGCVTDLKTAAAIIAVLGIVTSPAVSWAIVRHAYVIKVTCALTAKSSSPDVVDINLNNGLSFGFGGNSGMGFGCLAKPKNNTLREGEKPEKDESTESFILFIKYTGWIVLIADVVFLVSSVHLLTRLFQGSDLNATYIFLVAGLVSVLLTFLYGMTYVCLCVFVSGNFPITGVNTAGFLCIPPCKDLYEVSSPIKLVANVFRWLLFSSELLLLASIFGFLLGIFYIGIGSFGYMSLAKLCGDQTGLMSDLVKYFSFAAIASNTFLAIASIIFLIAACMDRFEITATLFLLAILIFLVVNLASIIVVVVAIITDSGCRQNSLYLSALILFPMRANNTSI